MVRGRQAERPHTALIIASSLLSNPCKDYLRDYEENNRPPFRIKYWERPVLERLTEGRDDFLARFLLTGMRNQSEILEAEQEFFDRVWYDRSQVLARLMERGERPMNAQIMEMARAAREEVEAKYGKGNLGPYDEFSWGMISGKLSALRWVLGEEWDVLDT
jgi:S-methylmethionine-dependent homocysteine/selenocysteine methylase